MKFEIGGSTYRLRFEHYHARERLYHDRTDEPFDISNTTGCVIEIYDETAINGWSERPWRQVAEGVAYCSVSDQYLKETGRQISLRRAVEELINNWTWAGITPREIRRIVFRTYFGRKEARA